ncbi:hypothetical protein M1563_00775 [Patescibacteria group bacterium]|nr:hypothetical protein [Patescibacteria group bacterium]MCL5410149.1 hypothetical protein [Patescibacteria group bacterium]
MTKNPLINAFAATLYIVIIASVMTWGGRSAGPDHSILAPIAVVSLFTLSAAVMGYLFLYQPGMLFIEGKKKEAVDLFLKTVVIFAGVTILALTLLFSGLSSI